MSATGRYRAFDASRRPGLAGVCGEVQQAIVVLLDLLVRQERPRNLPDLRSSPDVARRFDSCQSREDANNAQVHYRHAMTECEASDCMSGVHAYMRELHQF